MLYLYRISRYSSGFLILCIFIFVKRFSKFLSEFIVRYFVEIIWSEFVNKISVVKIEKWCCDFDQIVLENALKLLQNDRSCYHTSSDHISIRKFDVKRVGQHFLIHF